MSEWQPIDLAPMDGTVVDLWVTTPELDGKPYRGGLGRPVLRRPTGIRVCNWKWDTTFDCWRKAKDAHFVNRLGNRTPTHFMLPPEPPR